MAWDNAVVTNTGANLLGQTPVGGQMWLDGATGGTGTVPPAALMAQTALTDQRQTFHIVSISDVPGGKKKIGVQITSAGLSSGYIMRQLGIWMRAGDEARLYSILQDSTGIYIPSESELPDFSMIFYAIVSFSNKASLSITVDPSALVSHQVLSDVVEQHNISETAHTDFRDGVSAALDKLDKGKADISEDGKIPFSQLPEMNYDTAGSAAKVQESLLLHTANTDNPHGVTATQIDAATSGAVAAVGEVLTAHIKATQAAFDATVPTSRQINGQALTQDITIEVGGVKSVAGKTGAVTLDKSDVGLGNVNNTTDEGKPISTATQNALNGKVNTNAEGTTFCGIDANNSGKIKPERACAAIKTVTANTTLGLTHSGCLVAVNSTAARTITVPINSTTGFPVGAEIEVMRQNTGSVTIAFTSGVTVWCAKTERTIADRYTSVCLKKMATDTWLLQGNVG